MVGFFSPTTASLPIQAEIEAYNATQHSVETLTSDLTQHAEWHAAIAAHLEALTSHLNHHAVIQDRQVLTQELRQYQEMLNRIALQIDQLRQLIESNNEALAVSNQAMTHALNGV